MISLLVSRQPMGLDHVRPIIAMLQHMIYISMQAARIRANDSLIPFFVHLHGSLCLFFSQNKTIGRVQTLMYTNAIRMIVDIVFSRCITQSKR